eukprot:gene13352-9560_t
MPIVLISLIDADHQWFKSRFGFAAQQTHRDYAFCAYTILEETPRVMVVPDAQLDARFKANPVVIGPPYVRFYGGASIIVQGQKTVSDLVTCTSHTVPRDIPCSTNLFAYDQTPLFTHPDVLSVLTAALVHAIARSTVFATERVVVFYDASAEALNVSLVVAHQTTDGAAAPSLAALLRDAAASPLGRVLQAAETLLAWVGGRLQCHHGDQQQRLLLSVYATSAAPCGKKPPVECDTLAVMQGLSWKPQVTASVMRELTLPLRPDALLSAHGPAQPQSMKRAAPSDGDGTPPSLSMRVKPAPDGSSGLLQTTSEPSSSRRTSHSTQATDVLSPRRKPCDASSPCEGDAHREAVRPFATQWVAQWRPPWAGWALWPGATVHPTAQQ